jgi:hypothetical protein
MESTDRLKDTPSISDILSEGEAMETATAQVGKILRGQAEATYGQSALECRKLALGLLAIGIDLMPDETRESEPNKNLAYYHACVAAFLQGAGVSERLISEGQYVKATAALKQDYELLARIYEAEAGCAVEGVQPNVRHAPSGSQRHYGELNKVAHPSNLDALMSVISLPTGGLSILPVFVRTTAISLYKFHLWMCCEMVRLVLCLVITLRGEDDAALVCEEQYEFLQERVARFLVENASAEEQNQTR